MHVRGGVEFEIRNKNYLSKELVNTNRYFQQKRRFITDIQKMTSDHHYVSDLKKTMLIISYSVCKSRHQNTPVLESPAPSAIFCALGFIEFRLFPNTFKICAFFQYRMTIFIPERAYMWVILRKKFLSKLKNFKRKFHTINIILIFVHLLLLSKFI